MNGKRWEKSTETFTATPKSVFFKKRLMRNDALHFCILDDGEGQPDIPLAGAA